MFFRVNIEDIGTSFSRIFLAFVVSHLLSSVFVIVPVFFIYIECLATGYSFLRRHHSSGVPHRVRVNGLYGTDVVLSAYRLG